MNITPNTVIRRIKNLASTITKPPICTNRVYEVDELKTYIKRKSAECWVIYALDKQNGQVIDLKVGRRTKINLQRVTETLLLSKCKQIYTDALNTYRQIIPAKLHKVKRCGTNKIERKKSIFGMM